MASWTLYSHSASLHPPFTGVQMGTSKCAGVTLRWTSIPSRGSSNTPRITNFEKKKILVNSNLVNLVMIGDLLKSDACQLY